jgi:transketolase
VPEQEQEGEQNLVERLENEARDCRRRIVQATFEKETHIGGALSATDIMTALYLHFLNVDPRNPDWEDRDRFILSKGHVVYILYTLLAKRGFFPLDDLKFYDSPGKHLGGHPSRSLPGVDLSTGSLGHGLSVAVGMALVGLRENRQYKVYVMVGDGEMQEGSLYEAAMSAAKYRLENLILILDHNGIQTDFVDKLMPLGSVEEKWRSFGWSTRVIDGHDMRQIVTTFKDIPLEKGKPTAIIAETVKGKGVPLIENTARSHSMQFTMEERDAVLVGLGED